MIDIMFDGFISRQPIFARDLGLYAYELRVCVSDSGREVTPMGDTLSQASNAIALDELTGPLPAMITSPLDLMAGNAIAWPAERLILKFSPEVLDQNSDLSSLLPRFQATGYTVSIDGEWQGLDPSSLQLPDGSLITLSATSLPPESILRHYKNQSNITLLAQNINEPDQYEQMKQLGCDLFQGTLFEKPRQFTDTVIPAERSATLHLLARLQDPSIEIDEIEILVSRNATLSYKLLRLLNSAFFARPQTVDSIQRAVIFFGLERLRNWASVIALNSVDYQPRELITTALVRARTAQLLAQTSVSTNSGHCYIAGLFSTLDGMMQAPMATIVEQLNLVPDIKQALIDGSGDVGEVLTAIRALEQGQCSHGLSSRLEPGVQQKAYLNAISVASEVLGAIA
ncbi:MAG TPA: HDOD domain-containing protein [Chromatiales bacterium]|jgi:EAL and modified HD-GYP domain-containing signal transduction protein|nr:HDOD domain-containing protein [Chromatiaceae bacterium]HIN81806.1 HDOD domain-containing protein [Chromatiales bacterium]HIO13599.1 HDOD domain-containing protein [Chromatiales bacterium]HIO53965.1 HDOD domain-containing protein [Chromatiales bacterium]